MELVEALLGTLALFFLSLLDKKRERKHREAFEEIWRRKEAAKRVLLGLLSLFLLFLPAFGQGLVGRASVVDGDTLEVHGQRIRLWGIDTVESSQTCLDLPGEALALRQAGGLRPRRLHRAEPRGLHPEGHRPLWKGGGGVRREGRGAQPLARGGGVGARLPPARRGRLPRDPSGRRKKTKRGIWQGNFVPPWEYRRDPKAPPSAGSYTGAKKEGRCDPAYPTVCVPPPPPDLDCGDIPYRGFKVLPPDPHRFDRDRDGIGCER